MPHSPSEILQERYRVVKLLGQGGFGAVYRAWDLNLQRPCAIKENLETGLESREQFEREARMLSNLSHPNLPRVTDYFTIPGLGQYLVMDFIEGEDLQEKLDLAGGPLPISEALPWIEQVSAALAYLHGQSPPIIHRDIKPKNIIIRPDGKAFVVDFGIAKLFSPSQLTTIGARAVTPGYSPVEQYGHGKTDARSDIYALGATFYTLLTRVEPVESVQRSETSLLPPRGINPHIPQELERAILKAMEIAPSNRFRTMDEFSAALQPSLQVQVSPTAVVSPAVAQTMIAGSGAPGSTPADLGGGPPGASPPGSIPPSTDTPAAYPGEPARRRSAWPILALVLAILILGGAAVVFGVPALRGEPLPLFGGESASQTPTPSPSLTPTRSASPSPTLTRTSAPTATRRPSATPRPATPTPKPTNTKRATSTARPTSTTAVEAVSTEVKLLEPTKDTRHIYQGGTSCGPDEVTFTISATGPIGEDQYLMFIFWNIQDKASGSAVGWNSGQIMTKRRGENTWTYTFNANTMAQDLAWPEAWFLYQFVLQERTVNPTKIRTGVYSDITFSRCP